MVKYNSVRRCKACGRFGSLATGTLNADGDFLCKLHKTGIPGYCKNGGPDIVECEECFHTPGRATCRPADPADRMARERQLRDEQRCET
jgi:hypothetical protein